MLYFEFETVLKFCNLEASKYEMGWLANSIFNASGDLLSADNLCKQFGPRLGQTKCPVCSGSQLSDTDGTPEIEL